MDERARLKARVLEESRRFFVACEQTLVVSLALQLGYSENGDFAEPRDTGAPGREVGGDPISGDGIDDFGLSARGKDSGARECA